ncbi:MAG: TolC family protein [Bacteroidales bacterium]|nr:TolC family protein [Bacteroidales bacterium]
MRFFILLVCLVTFLMPGSVGAQTWTFRQCLDTALTRNISINQSILSKDLSKITLEQNKASRIPGVSASLGENLSMGWNIDPTTNQYVDQAYHSTNFSVSSSLLLFNGLQNANTIRQNRLNLQASSYDIDKVKNDVTLDITTGYLQLLFSCEILKTAVNQALGTKAQVELTEKFVNAGKLPESNLLQIKSQLATDNLSVVTAENQLAMAKVTLLQLMEMPVSDSFEVYQPEFPEPSIRLVQTNQQIYEKALSVQPQITSAFLKTKASEYSLKVSKGARYPRLNLGASLGSNYASSRTKGSAVNPENYPFFEQMWNNLGQTVNLNLSIPIYSQRSVKSNIDRASINLLNMQLSEQYVKNQLRKSVEQAYTDLKAAIKKYDATQEQLAAAELSYKAAEQKYTVGLMHATDFLIEKNAYFKAQSNMIQVKYETIFRNKILDFYKGIPITF